MDRRAEITENLQRVQEKIAAAEARSSRSTHSVKLVVVSKGQPVEVIHSAIQAGVRDFGENYPEESIDKMDECSEQDVSWHMIGHLQSRKSGIVAARFDWLHSLDSVKLAGKLNRQLQEHERILPVLLQFNVGGEESKSGWLASEKKYWEFILDDVHQIIQMANLQVRGLMTMPPLEIAPENAQTHFRKLRSLQQYLSEKFPQTSWSELSMGTSSDFETAIEAGATIVRIGSAILGPRPSKTNPVN